jgi:dihydrofolate synthase / folylpolyglutamate synthase
MTYSQAIDYLKSFINYEKIAVWSYKESFKLKRFRDFLAIIGDPQKGLKCVHVAGSKGKGSTCAFISYILRQAGYKVGLYTSPHLNDFRERIRILSHKVTRSQGHKADGDFEGMIPQKELLRLVQKFKPAIDKFNLCLKHRPLSFFEVYTALAFVYFKEKKVDFAVLETGLGGRLDATNTVNPLVCVITPISYEHTRQLGNTLRKIAREKAGIIKSHKVTRSQSHQLVVISAPQEKEALGVIKKKCKETGARLYEVGKDIKYQKIDSSFTVFGLKAIYPDLSTRLLGSHQLINASAAIGAVEALSFYRSQAANFIREGLYNTVWPGRCEVVSKKPLIILDGAQNTASVRVLKKAVKEKFSYKKLVLVLGVCNDKDIKGICREFYDFSDKIILTKANNPRATEPEELAGYFSAKGPYITGSTKEARLKALRLAGKDDLILVTGSLFVVGEFRG